MSDDTLSLHNICEYFRHNKWSYEQKPSKYMKELGKVTKEEENET